MADNCKICGKSIGHTQYNIYCGMCEECYENPYRDLKEKQNEASK